MIDIDYVEFVLSCAMLATLGMREACALVWYEWRDWHRRHRHMPRHLRSDP